MKDRLVYKHNERHYVSRTGWLRAAVLGANDGIISVSSLVIGVAAYAGGAPPLKPALRIMFWGAAAMGFTAIIGSFFGLSA